MGVLKKEPIINYSSSHTLLDGKIPHLKNKDTVRIKGKSIGGDAPKAIIRKYEYGSALRANHKSWPTYIAKVGQKWYPIESITEQLFTDIGKLLKLNIADSELWLTSGQLRFLSKFFLQKDERLIHGAEIYAAYLNQDLDFILDLEQNRLSKEFLTFTFTFEVIEALYEECKEEIVSSLVKMITFDAITGNSDRHFYNWGIIEDIRGKKSPRFAPIYDTARGLFWNYPDSKLFNIYSNSTIEEQIVKYCNDSKPKIGAEDNPNLNHFDFIQFLCVHYEEYIPVIQTIIDNYDSSDFEELLFKNYSYLLTDLRKQFIFDCIEHRVTKLYYILNHT
tara:strand:- start:17628 stop:18629 length:1002 start_codon:yes stop_codon:yes gene_type:complete